jgi:hypothetical protein
MRACLIFSSIGIISFRMRVNKITGMEMSVNRVVPGGSIFYFLICVKVKLSRYRPGQAFGFPGG